MSTKTKILMTTRHLKEIGQAHPLLLEMFAELVNRWPEDTAGGTAHYQNLRAMKIL